MKLFVTTKDNLIIYALIAVLFGSLVLFNHDAVAEVFENASPKRDLPIYCVDKGEEKICSVSFDAACPDCKSVTLLGQTISSNELILS